MITIAKADGSIIIDTHINTNGFATGATNIESQFTKIGNAAKKMGALIATAFSVTAVIQFGKEASQAAMNLESALLGLESIVEGQGRSFAAAQQFINEYISDGLIPAENAVAAYKNLAARGYDDTQIQQVMTALKDASAFGRQASLSMGKAVQGATEGLKNENSVLVDNAGVTKNVSKMWEEYAASIGTTANNLTQAQKIQAEVNGILAETQYQTGDAAKAAGTLSGQLAKLTFNFNNLKVAIGNIINPIVQWFLPAINNAIAALTEFANNVATVISLVFGEVTTSGTTAASTMDGVSSSYDSAADSASNYGSAVAEASKETKKSLAGFDELNKLQSNAEDASTGAGTSTGGGATLGTTTETTVETTVDDTVSPKLQEIADKIRPVKEALEELANSGLEVLKEVLEGLQPLGDWLWNDFLVPMADFLGFDVEGINSLADALSRLADWIDENQIAINNFLIAVATIATVLNTISVIGKLATWFTNLAAGVTTVSGLFAKFFPNLSTGFSTLGTLFSNVGTWITGTLVPGISSALSAIASALGISVGWVVAIIAAVIAAIALIVIYWDEIKLFFTETLPNLFKKFKKWLSGILEDAAELFSKAWEKIKEFFSPAVEWFRQLWESVSQTVEDIFYNIGVIASGCWEIIKKVWSVVSDWFKKTVIEPVANWFTGMWDKLKEGAAQAWEGIKEVFSKVGKFFSDTFKAAWEKVCKVFSPMGEIFVNIKDGILNAFKSIVNGLIKGLNNVISIPFKGINKALQFIKDIEILGLTPFSSLKTISVPQIPYLAQGAVIPPNAPFMAVLGDQRNGTNIEAPADLIRQIVRDELASGASNDEVAELLRELIQVVMGIQVGDEVIGKAAARYNRRVSRAGGY